MLNLDSQDNRRGRQWTPDEDETHLIDLIWARIFGLLGKCGDVRGLGGHRGRLRRRGHGSVTRGESRRGDGAIGGSLFKRASVPNKGAEGRRSE